MPAPTARSTWAEGLRVYFHGINPVPDRQATVVSPSKPDDLRALVRWDGTEKAVWSTRSALRPVGVRCCALCQAR